MDKKADRAGPTGETSTSGHEDWDIQFLLAEFNQLGEFYRHTNSRIYTIVNVYLTFFAAATTVSVLLFGYLPDVRIFLIAVLPLLVAILLLGYILGNHLADSTITTRGYLLGLNLIRRYFVDEYGHLAPYLVLPTAAPAGNTQQTLADARPRAMKEVLVTMIVINSALSGCIVAIIFWLVTPGFVYSLLSAIVIGIVAALAASLVLYRRLGSPLNIGAQRNGH